MSKIGCLSSGPACEPAKLIIEVVGLKHPESQRLMLSDHGSDQPTSINDQSTTETLEEDKYCSTLHIWPEPDAPSCDVWLEINSISGAPIRLPLANAVTVSPRQPDGQWNQIVPILPMTEVSSGVADENAIPVLTRPGYLYVFQNGNLWRELEIRQSEAGTTYHDVDLKQWRDAGRPEHLREATGVALEEVWLPARWMNRAVADIQLAYSEVQWSAPRIQRLEADAPMRAQRCQRIAMPISNRQFVEMTRGPDGENLAKGLLATLLTNNAAGMAAATEAERRRTSISGRAFPLSLVEPQRPRQELMEYMFNEPAGYLLDLQGKHPEQCLAHAAERFEAYLNRQPLPSGDAEPDALAVCIERHLLPTREEEDRTTRIQRINESEKNWQALPAVEDVLKSSRERYITGVLLTDGLYRMRQLKDRMEALQGLINLAAEIAAQRPHFASALLVNNFILSHQMGREQNPLRRYATALDGQGINTIRRILGGPLKRNSDNRHEKIRNLLASCLDDAYHQQTLADVFSLKGDDYRCAFSLTGQLLAATASALRDPLRLVPALRIATADRFLVQLQQKNHPLRLMLLPKSSLDGCMKPYELPSGEEPNEGDGCFRPKTLAQQEIAPLSAPEDLMLLESRILTGAAKDGFFNTIATAGMHRGIQLSLSIAASVQGALTQAETRIRQLGLTIEEAQLAQATLDATRADLGRAARPLQISAFQLDGIELSRAMAPETLGAMRIERTGNVTDRSLIILPPELVNIDESQTPRRMTGRIYAEEGRLVAATNAGEAAAAGLLQAKTQALFLTLPINHPMAQGIQDGLRQLADATTAQERAFNASNEINQINRAGEARRRALRLLNSPVLPPVLVGFEVFNLKSALSQLDRMSRQRGEWRARIGVASSTFDLALATQLLAERIGHDIKAIQRVTSSMNKELFHNRFATGRIFASQIVVRMFFGAVGAIALSGLSFWDAVDAFNHGDNGGWGHLLMAGGGLAMLTSVFMAGPAAGAAGLSAFIGPAGWVLLIGVGLTLAGVAVLRWLSDEPIEQWLKLGPFGTEEIDGLLWLKGEKPAHLQDEHEAFYRLAGLLSGIRIEIGDNPHQREALISRPEHGNEAYFYQMRSANKRIKISSNIPGLIGALGEHHMRVGISLTETTSTDTRGGPIITTYPVTGKQFEMDTQQMKFSCSVLPDFVIRQELSAAGLEVYVKEPAISKPSVWQNLLGGPRIISMDWAVRVQIIVEGSDQRAWHFPAPEPKDPLRYDNAQHERIDFFRTRRAFWADEAHHGAEPTS